MGRLSTGSFFRRRFGIALGYSIVVLIWGTTWYGMSTQVNGTAPHVAVALRLAMASLIFFAIAGVMGLRLRLQRKQLVLIAIQGVCFYGLNYVAVYTAAQYLTSGVLAVVFSITVPFNIVADRILFGARPRLAVVLATLIGVGGIALVFSGELEQALGTRSALWGAALAIFAAGTVAIGNVMAARLAATDLGVVRLNAFGFAAGTITILLWGVLSGASWSLNVTPTWLAGYAYLVVIGSLVAFGIYMKILPVVGPVAGAYVVVLSPVIALMISVVLEGLPLGTNMFLGVVLLLTGHSILIARRRRVSEDVNPAHDEVEAASFVNPLP